MTKRNVVKGIVFSVLIAGLTLAALGSASARTVPPDVGRAINFSDEGCFSLWYSAVTNNCSTQRAYEMPMVVDSAGNKTVYVNAYGAGTANNVGCRAVATDAQVSTYWASPTVYLSSFGSAQTITLNGAYVPSGGRMYVTCYMNPGGRVNSVNFNP